MSGVDNIIAALEHHDQVSQIELNGFSSSELGYVTNSVAMQKPFPELTDLVLGVIKEDLPILPNSFLGGIAPCLRSLQFRNVPFPGLPKLLQSATHLVDLNLQNIPHYGYISPEAISTSLSTLTNLEKLSLCFQCPHISPRGPFFLRHALSSPVLQKFDSKGSANIWRTS